MLNFCCSKIDLDNNGLCTGSHSFSFLSSSIRFWTYFVYSSKAFFKPTRYSPDGLFQLLGIYTRHKKIINYYNTIMFLKKYHNDRGWNIYKKVLTTSVRPLNPLISFFSGVTIVDMSTSPAPLQSYLPITFGLPSLVTWNKRLFTIL